MIKLILGILNLKLKLLSTVLFKKTDVTRVHTVCVYRPGNIGDIVCAIPALKAIRSAFPGSRYILLSSPTQQEHAGAKEILGNAGWIDELLSYSSADISTVKGLRMFARKLCRNKIDLWIELAVDPAPFPLLLRHMFFVRLCGIRHAIGFHTCGSTWLSKIVSDKRVQDHESLRLAELLALHGIRTPEIRFDLPVLEQDKKRVSEILQKRMSMGIAPVIAFNPGAKRLSNRWPVERYATLAEKVMANTNGFILLTGSASEKALADSLTNVNPHRIISLIGEISVLQCVEVYSRCKLLVSNDTGAVHLAAAAGIPVIGLYSPWQNKGRWYPHGKNHQVIVKDCSCSPCFRNNCQTRVCMEAISVEEVWERMAAYF